MGYHTPVIASRDHSVWCLLGTSAFWDRTKAGRCYVVGTLFCDWKKDSRPDCTPGLITAVVDDAVGCHDQHRCVCPDNVRPTSPWLLCAACGSRLSRCSANHVGTLLTNAGRERPADSALLQAGRQVEERCRSSARDFVRALPLPAVALARFHLLPGCCAAVGARVIIKPL